MMCEACGVGIELPKRRWCSEVCRARGRRAGSVAVPSGDEGDELAALREAAEETVAALREMGRFERVDSAQIEAFLELASAVDRKPGDAGLWRAFHAAEAALREVGKADAWQAAGDAILAKFDDPPRRLET